MRLLLVVVFLVLFVVIIIVDEIAIFRSLAFFFLIVLLIRIIGDEIKVNGMRLRDLEFRFTLGTTQDLAFFDFVFVHIDFGGTFRATDHGTILRRVVRNSGLTPSVSATVQRIIYRDIRSQLLRAV
jgi:hypothetical protein